MPSNYQPGIPTGSVPLSIDFVNLKNNFQQLDTTFGSDHLPFSNTSDQNGYHTTVHLYPFSTTATNMPNNVPPITPPRVVGFGELFSCEINDGFDVDNTLFWKTGGNRLSQLTANFTPIVTGQSGFSGRSYLPGPGASSGTSGTIMVQWGKYNGPLNLGGQNGSITLPTAFSNRIISVWTQLEFLLGHPPTENANLIIDDNFGASNSAFNWFFRSASGSYTGFLWVAIGT